MVQVNGLWILKAYPYILTDCKVIMHKRKENKETQITVEMTFTEALIKVLVLIV